MDVSKADLRKFGIGLAVLLPVLFYGVLPWLFGIERLLWPWAVAAGILIAAVACPVVLRPVYKLLMWVAVPLGRLNSVLLLGLVYFLMVVPMGLIMRMVGKDPIPKKFDSSAVTYRRKSPESTSLEMLF
ncbi:SxtJ family membrane protein [Marinobacter sp. CHS3-4]|uniref:SxtJ family membrane protein n=1 Tax=Marinobacter sp. CHS3-4 TaxID=3045174 RepID=UPI0024B5FFEF|nr:SxtJ family membrane protein [Marinobacter sp. CHS3-4]MDI9245566.1 SxtJ family membrane protein [Marinobacter sp. CHS3-4]